MYSPRLHYLLISALFFTFPLLVGAHHTPADDTPAAKIKTPGPLPTDEYARNKSSLDYGQLHARYAEALVCGYAGPTGVIGFYFWFSGMIAPLYAILQLLYIDLIAADAMVRYKLRKFPLLYSKVSVGDADKVTKKNARLHHERGSEHGRIKWWLVLELVSIAYDIYRLVMTGLTYRKCATVAGFEIIRGLWKAFIAVQATQLLSAAFVVVLLDMLKARALSKAKQIVLAAISCFSLYCWLALGWFVYYHPISSIGLLHNHGHDYMGLFVSTRALMVALIPFFLWVLMAGYLAVYLAFKIVCCCKFWWPVLMMATAVFTLSGLGFAAVGCVRLGNIAGDPWGLFILKERLGKVTAAVLGAYPPLTVLVAFAGWFAI